MPVTDPSLHIDRIDNLTESFNSEFGDLPVDNLNWKPDAQSWSIAQIIDHLIVINSTYYPIFDRILNDTYQAPVHARLGFLVRFFGKTILHSVDPKNRRKAKTFDIWEPAQSDLPADIVSRFVSHQAELNAYIEKLGPYFNSDTVIHSPANKMIVYKLETAIEIIITHEERHLEQARTLLPLVKSIEI